MSQLVSCGKSIVTHNINTPEPISVFNPHQSNINCAVWNHNNQVIASCGNDGAIFLSHSQKAQVLLQLEDSTNPPKPIISVSFTSNSQYLASGGQEGLVKIWDLKKKGLQNTLKGHFSQVNSVNWNSTDSLIASCSNAGEIIIHDVPTQLQIANFSLNAKTPGFKCLKFSPLRKSYLISGSNDGSVTVWDVTLRDQVANYNSQHQSKVTALACSLFNENLFCSSGIDQKVNFYDIGTKSYNPDLFLRIVKTLQCDNPLTALAFHNDGHSIAVGTLYGSILIYDLRQTSQAKKQLKGHENSSINYLEFVRPSEEDKNSSIAKSQSAQLKDFYTKQSPSIKDENQSPFAKSLSNLMETEKKNETLNKNSLNVLDEIKRETLQRLEQSKQSNLMNYNRKAGRLSSQKPPTSVTQTVPQAIPQSAASEKYHTQQRDSAGKTFSQIRDSFDNYSGKIEDLNKKYEKMPINTQVMQQQTQNGFNEEQKKYLNDLFNEQLQSVKHYVSDQIGGLHIDMIRQFQIQQNDFQTLFDRYLLDQNQLIIKLNNLEQENQQLRRTSY